MATHGDRPTKRVKLSLASFQDPLRILLGTDEVEVSVPRSMICGESGFFKTACKPEWMDAGSNTVMLNEEDPIIFGLFLTWLHTGDISESEEFITVTAATAEEAKEQRQGQWIQLVKCYLLGELLLAPEFKNSAINSLIFLCKKLWEDHRTVAGIEAESISLIYENTPASSPLRFLVVKNCFKHASPDNPTIRAASSASVPYYAEFLAELAIYGLLKAREFDDSWCRGSMLLTGTEEVWNSAMCSVYHEHAGAGCGSSSLPSLVGYGPANLPASTYQSPYPPYVPAPVPGTLPSVASGSGTGSVGSALAQQGPPPYHAILSHRRLNRQRIPLPSGPVPSGSGTTPTRPPSSGVP